MRLDRLLEALDGLVSESRIRVALPESNGQDRAEAVLDHAIQRFRSFHSRRTIAPAAAGGISVDPRLALYYSNRLDGYGLESITLGSGT